MNAAMIQLHTVQAEQALAHFVAVALRNAGSTEGEYKLAAHKDVETAVKLLAGWLEVVPGAGYYQDTHRSFGGDPRHFFIRTEPSKELEINRDSAFELTVGRARGYMVTVEIPRRGERVFISEHDTKEAKAATKISARYYGGCTASITAQPGSWIEVDGEGNADSFQPIGSEHPVRVRHAIRVGESVTV